MNRDETGHESVETTLNVYGHLLPEASPLALADFLLARIDEGLKDAWVAFQNYEGVDPDAWLEADAAAKRRIVEDFRNMELSKAEAAKLGHPWRGDLWQAATCRTMQHLAAVYSDHPDYRDEWRP